MAKTNPFVKVVCIMCAFGLFGGVGQAALPPLDQAKLTSVLDQYQNQIPKLHATYVIERRTAQNADSSQDRPTTRDGSSSGSLEAIYDFVRHVDYLKRSASDVAPSLEVSFDGARGRALRGPDGSRQTEIGVLTLEPPPEMRLGPTHIVHPAEAAYWPLPARDLASIIRSASQIRIVEDSFEGAVCYRVTVLVEPLSSDRAAGKAPPAPSSMALRLWLVPERNMMPARIDWLHQGNVDTTSGQVLASQRPSDFREIRPGVWFPFASRYSRTSNGVDVDLCTLRVQSLLADETVVTRQVEFPFGTTIIDTILQTKYAMGSPNMPPLSPATASQESRLAAVPAAGGDYPSATRGISGTTWFLLAIAVGAGVIAGVYVIASRRCRRDPVVK